MGTRRVVLGRYNDGLTIGLRVSLPGYDALTDDSSEAGKFSFDSEWTDIVEVHQVSLSARQTAISIYPHVGVTIDGWLLTWPALGYKPFVEARVLNGNTIYDDYMSVSAVAGWHSGHGGQILTPEPNQMYIQGGQSGEQMLSIIYKVPVPV